MANKNFGITLETDYRCGKEATCVYDHIDGCHTCVTKEMQRALAASALQNGESPEKIVADYKSGIGGCTIYIDRTKLEEK
ncbi:hypothetical protein FWF74_00640 [Candidatus Saccharibacteria bacterium]|nr:hypothetical protein [Candidatus Saccharibacteria bacterium]MCL1963314.1 hypothetical protein [Candidatus Saccharibacteria bacterium]